MTPGDFPKLMADVKQFHTILEKIFEIASNPMEKELLGSAIRKIRDNVAAAETAVPQAFQAIEAEAKKIQAEAEVLKEEFAKKRVEAEALKAEDDRLEAARKAAQPPLADLYGPITVASGFDLRLDMLNVLGFGSTAISPEDAARALGHHREIWEDWHWE